MRHFRRAIRLAAVAAAALALASCTQDQHDTPNKGAHPTHTRATIYATNQTASFKVNPGKRESPYMIVFERGEMIDATRDALSGTGDGDRLGSVCHIHSGDKAIPFTLRARWDDKTTAQEAIVSLHSYRQQPDGEKTALTPGSVQIELARPGMTPRCEADTSVASTAISYQKTLAPEAPMFSGWLILHNQGQDAKAGLAVTSTVPYDTAHGSITSIRGFEPYTPWGNTKALISGGSMLFKASASV